MPNEHSKIFHSLSEFIKAIRLEALKHYLEIIVLNKNKSHNLLLFVTRRNILKPSFLRINMERVLNKCAKIFEKCNVSNVNFLTFHAKKVLQPMRIFK